MMEETIKVIKIGGNVVDKPEALARFIDDFVKLPGRKIRSTAAARKPHA